MIRKKKSNRNKLHCLINYKSNIKRKSFKKSNHNGLKKKLNLLGLDGQELLDLQKRAWRTSLKQPTCLGLIFLKRQMACCLRLIIFLKNKVDYLSLILTKPRQTLTGLF